MAYHHLRLNIHDISLYIIAILLFAVLLSLLYCICHNLDKTIILSARGSRKSSFLLGSRQQSFLLREEADAQHDACQAGPNMTPKASHASLRSLTEHEKEILEIHCEECERPRKVSLKASTLSTTAFNTHNNATIMVKTIV